MEHNSCCGSKKAPNKPAFKPDIILHGSLAVIVIAVILFIAAPGLPYIGTFTASILDLLKQMWWGIVLGFIAIGLMHNVPREYFTYMLGKGDTAGGIFRAALAGLLLDLCSHGILMVGAKLYERGASLAQVMTFLIASPWNSLSLTLILIALVGLKWTLVYILASALIAIATGFIYLALARDGHVAHNPNATELPEGFTILADAGTRLKGFRADGKFFKELAANSWSGGKMILRWLLFGTILAAAIRTFVPVEIFQDYFGPTLVGLGLTLLATTIIEVCSEGSAPIAGDLLTRAAAPGNGFAFLMAGVATDYTEILVIREFTKSWKTALSLPLLTVPQILLIGWAMNGF